MGLIGRSLEIEGADATTTSMTLIVGDSGTGKSALLEAAQAFSDHAIAPPPVRVSRSPGSLQRALLEALGASLAEIAEDQTATERIGELIVAAAGKVRDKRLIDLKATVGRHLLGALRAKVGDELAAVVEDFSDALSKSSSEILSERITSASDTDVVDQLVDFANEIVQLDEQRTIYLALDDVDRLEESDLRRLVDLAEKFPPRVRLRCSFATWDANGRSRADKLLASSPMQVVPLAGLSSDHVSRWLREAGLSESLTDAVMTCTNGYPIYVQDAIAILKSDGPEALSLLQPDGVLKARLKEAWRGLDSVQQVAVSKLCVYVDPISDARVCSLLGIDPLAWGAMEIELRDSGLFVGSDRSWFHELRRRVVVNEVLSDAMRAHAVSSALEELSEHLSRPSPELDAFVDYARLAGLDEATKALPCVAAAVSASRDEIAIAAAVLELIDHRSGDEAIDAEILLEHVRTTAGFASDPLAALDSLVAQDLMVVVSNEHSAVIVPTWGSVEAIRVIVGRTASELGTGPIQSRGTAIFEAVIRPALGAFEFGNYGIGRLPVAKLSGIAGELHQQPTDGTIRFRRERASLALLGSHGSVPVHGTFSFSNLEDRDLALRKVRSIAGQLWDLPIEITTSVGFPGPAVPALRFAQALEWLEGGKFNLHLKSPSTVEQPVDVELALNQQLAVREWARSLTSDWEKFAYGIEERSGSAFEVDGSRTTIAEIVGGQSVQEFESGTIEWSGPYARLRAATILNLDPPFGEWVSRVASTKKAS